MSLNLDGLIPATVLPMSDGGVIDEAALRRYIGWIAPQGPVALAINADTGEGPHLTHQEKCRVIEVVAEETDLPIVAGVAGPFQAQAVAAGARLPGGGRQRAAGVPDLGLPEHAAGPAHPGQLPPRDRRGRAAR